MDYRDLEVGLTSDHFWFKAKKELIDILVGNACKNRKKIKILNIGIGTGDELEVLNRYGDNYVVDIDKDALACVSDGLCREKLLANACNLPYEDKKFDMVVAFDVFEHIDNDKKATEEINRVLKKRGMLVFTVPAHNFLFSSHDRALNHYRRYSKSDMRALLCDFKSLNFFYWNSLLFLPVATKRLIDRNAHPRVDHLELPFWLNRIFLNLLKFDNFIIGKGLSLPLGVSIVGVAVKD